MKNINKKNLKKILYKMLLIRETDLQISRRYSESQMRCPTHLSIGQECVPSVVGAFTSKKDLCVSSHRSHAHYLGKGGSLKKFISELYGKSTGCSKGRGGSMHLTDLNVGFVGSTAIVSNSIPVGVGLSLSSKILGKKQITIIYLGDASVEEGVFFESLNFAIVKKIPVIFVCENNFYSVYSPLSVRQPINREIYKMVRGCHIKAYKTNGNFTNEVISSFLKAKNFVEKNENIFDNGTPEGSSNLRHAIGGLIKTMPEVTLIMAPHLNSYRRLVSETHAPNIISWGYENRTVALRVPGGDNKSKRIEHRVAGSDVNPYMLISSIVLGANEGIEKQIEPPNPEVGNAYKSNNDGLPASWQASIGEFQNGQFIHNRFPKQLVDMFLNCKKQECQKLTSKVTDDEMNSYLNTV